MSPLLFSYSKALKGIAKKRPRRVTEEASKVASSELQIDLDNQVTKETTSQIVPPSPVLETRTNSTTIENVVAQPVKKSTVEGGEQLKASTSPGRSNTVPVFKVSF